MIHHPTSINLYNDRPRCGYGERGEPIDWNDGSTIDCPGCLAEIAEIMNSEPQVRT